jgi:hypothetical protein
MEYLGGAALGGLASRAHSYYRRRDEDRGHIHRRGIRRKPKPRGKRKLTLISSFKPKRAGKKVTKFTKGMNGGLKKTTTKNKKGTYRPSKHINKHILYPNSFKTTMYVGTPANTLGAGSDTQLGNMLFRLGPLSQDDAHSAFEIWRMVSLAKTADGSGNTTADLDVGTNSLSGTSNSTDIIDGTNQSKCLQTGTSSASTVQTLTHYMTSTGAIHRDFNPNHQVSGFTIDLKFLSYRQCKQALCVRLIRLRNEACEDQWGQSEAGSSTKGLSLMCGMVNSQKHIDPNTYDVLYECKTILPGYAPGAAHPKMTRVKKWYPCNYTITTAKRVYSHSTSQWGGELTPLTKRDNGYYNQVFLCYSVRPIQNQIIAFRDGQEAPGGTGSSNLYTMDAFEGASGSSDRGKNTSARFRVSGILRTHYKCQAVKRVNVA